MSTNAALFSPAEAAASGPLCASGDAAVQGAAPHGHDSGQLGATLPAQASRRLLTPFALAAVAFIIDQLSKWWAVGALTTALRSPSGDVLPPAASWAAFWSTMHPSAVHGVSIVKNFFDLRYVENPGAAWGFLARTEASWRTPFLSLVALGSMGVAVASLWGSRKEQHALRIGLALLLGGAMGNLTDRLRLGYVIDFIDWHWYQVAAWPTFNVADACISIGAGLLLCDFICELRRAPAAAKSRKLS